ncbi:polyubiquitin-like isoform X2 [Myxocyprinus asiaticus]|nr:polyubiquitin-like isoform X2 [Myxocyprinus asiaticus]
MDLTVKGISHMKDFRVGCNDKVGALKQLISQEFSVPTSQLRLSTVSGVLLDNDSSTLSSYCLLSGSTVMLIITKPPAHFQVIVINEKHKAKPYDVATDETVVQLQCKIFKEEGVPEDQQRLIYNGKQLEPSKRLQDYNIKSGSTIYMVLYLRGG